MILFQNSIQWRSIQTNNLTKLSNTYKYNITTTSARDWHFAVALFYNGITSGMVWGGTVYLTSEYSKGLRII
jgi:hypothetical protein